jgi:hypothetical protein
VYNATTGTSINTVLVNGSGVFTFSLPTGTYKLYVTTNKTGYPNQWYDNVAPGGGNLAGAIPITFSNTLNVPVPVHSP